MKSTRYDNHTPEERFREKFVAQGDDECWEWNAALNESGYGVMAIGAGADKRRVRAHRFSMELHLGRPLSSDEVVLHACDNPPCVNPKHLRVGTQHDNIRDAVSKMRHKHGENGAVKLTTDTVNQIKSALHDGIKQKDIARQFNVSRSLISMINNGKRWMY